MCIVKLFGYKKDTDSSKKNSKKIYGKRGFTLIEIVLIIAIIGILSAIAVPKFEEFIEVAKVRADESNIKILNNATKYYAAYENKNLTDISAEELGVNGEKLVPSFLANSPNPQSKGIKYLWIQEMGIWTLNMSDSGQSNEKYKGLLENLQNAIYKRGHWTIKDDVLKNKYWFEERMFIPNDNSQYEIIARVKLSRDAILLGNGYGIIFESKVKNSGNKIEDTGYIFQFDPGYNHKLILRERKNGSENDPFFIMDPSEKMIKNSSTWWTDEHDIKIIVKKVLNESNKKEVTIFVDDISIGEPIFIDALDEGEQGYVGFRTWGPSTTEFIKPQIKAIE
ncbi:prepilin-type N-terminal cleavage/methylation domain-containing protein [Crassaminicella thermophila]|uniref:Prepilin-type N-terminal cleavage/methylation domain-containing protein n=1 Tax=Crassaminicella thermophila TaxID=2599308 RepID=A0A5C0SEC5_CRATE|nr:prepilin-type N-terminal cleavage/methylation domain-containing protein [Crassaminicella thermophila]QEK12126.1 prepilin-type N-terminal cleavage/methylation domain-containing protein [Crassaminicella thermophila]